VSQYYDLSRIAQLKDVMGSDASAIAASILASMAGAIEEIEAALAAGELDRATGAAHSARNDALMVGAQPLLAALTELEAATRRGNADGAGGALERIRAVWPPTRDALAGVPHSDDSVVMQRRILLVDDHALNLKLLERLFEREGHEVRTAGSLAAAERVLAEEQPAMIVLDLNLPDGSGLEFTRKLRAHPLTAAIPIVACTAAVTASDEERALEAGCDAFLAKPIDLPRFSELIASILA
jgi:CheY-like chemotaxis protein